MSRPARAAGMQGVVGRLGLLVVTAIVVGLSAASSALADGTVEVTVTGGGSGSVSSTTDGAGTPGDLACDYDGSAQSGVCSSVFTGGAFGILTTVKLTATAVEGEGLFTGWSASGATVATRCTTPPDVDPTCELLLFGGPVASVTANFDVPPDPPVVTTDPASGVGGHDATLEGRVDPAGSPVGKCFFEYGIADSYGATVPCTPDAAGLGSGTGDVAVSAQTPALESGSTYHYRLVASNPGGTSRGEDRTFETTGSPSCSNSAIRAGQGISTVLLPDCMALEMISPPDKDGQNGKSRDPGKSPAISVDDDRVKFYSNAPLGGATAALSISGDPYVATRGGAGWDVAATSPPAGISRGWGASAEARSFSPDLTSWLLVGSTTDQFDVGAGQAFRGSLGGGYSVLSPLLVPNMAAGATGTVEDSVMQAVSADQSHLYLQPGGGFGNQISYLPSDPKPAGLVLDPDTYVLDPNTYVMSRGSGGVPSLELLARDRDDKVWGGNCGSHVGGVELVGTATGSRNQGAVSADGSRSYFATRPDQPPAGDCDPATNKLRILERRESDQGPWIGELVSPECDRVAPACDNADGDDRFQGASVGGGRVFFMTSRQLTDSDLDAGSECSSFPGASTGCDLYLYDWSLPVGERLVQVSAGEAVAGDHPTAGSGAGVLSGTVGISGDGSHVYFAAQGALTDDPSPAGATAVAGEPNLYLYERDDAHPDGQLSFVGTLASSDRGGLWGWHGTWRNDAYPVPVTAEDGDGLEIGGDGHVLVFESSAALTADDGDGGQRDVFRYDADAQTLQRLSQAGPGGDDDGAFDVTERPSSGSFVAAGTDFAERGRWVSEDGETVVFRTAEGLSGGDADAANDSYLWRDGELYRLPGTTDPSTADFPNGVLLDVPGVSHDGSMAVFASGAQLLTQDRDTAFDTYVVRVGGGFAPAAGEEEPCEGDGCHGPASVPPVQPDPGSKSLNGQGNVSPAPVKRRCGVAARRARGLERRARGLRRDALQLAPSGRSRRIARRARGLARRADRWERKARACRRANRRAGR